jgi:hypothetical protein
LSEVIHAGGRQNKNKNNTKHLPIAIRKQQKNKNSINNK